MTDRVTARGAEGSGAADPTRPDESPNRQLQAPASAVLDEAHLGDIEGAFGRIQVGNVGERHTWRQRLLTLAAIVGPGIIVMVGDNDAGGVSTYAQAGQNYHTTLLWTLLLLIPVLVVNQEMVVRLGAVTGVGHARLINERFGRGWGWFSVGDLFLLNFLTIVTEFIGISLAGSYAGISEYIAVPTAAVALVAIMATGSFRKWERAMFAFIAVTLVQVPLFFMSQPQWGTIGKNFVVPSIYGGPTSAAVLLIIAIVGTTVAPWQLFFQQSNIVDKRITPRFISYERADTVIGSLGGGGGSGRHHGHRQLRGQRHALLRPFHRRPGRGQPAEGEEQHHGGVVRHPALRRQHHRRRRGHALDQLRLRRRVRHPPLAAPGLQRRQAVLLQLHGAWSALAAAIVLIPGAPLGLITTSVQALAGLLLPSASVFLLLLCNDPEVLGPWVNPRWLNGVAAVIVGVLLVLSGTLMTTTVFPSVDVGAVFIWLSVVLAAGGLIVLIALRVWPGASGRPVAAAPPADRNGSTRCRGGCPPSPC